MNSIKEYISKLTGTKNENISIYITNSGMKSNTPNKMDLYDRCIARFISKQLEKYNNINKIRISYPDICEQQKCIFKNVFFYMICNIEKFSVKRYSEQVAVNFNVDKELKKNNIDANVLSSLLDGLKSVLISIDGEGKNNYGIRIRVNIFSLIDSRISSNGAYFRCDIMNSFVQVCLEERDLIYNEK